VRIAELDITSQAQIEDYLASLFDLFASLKARPQRKTPRRRVRTGLRIDFRLLGLLWLPGQPPDVQERRVKERDLLEGLVNTWQVDFAYQNTRKVAMSTVDLGLASPLDKAQTLTGVYLDVDRARKEDDHLGSVFQDPHETREQVKAERQLRSLPGTSYNYVDQRADLLRMVVEDLDDPAAASKFGQLFPSRP
jgi:hypothetical protein